MTCRHQTQAPGVMHRLLSAGTHRLQHAGCHDGVAHAGCETCPPHRWLSAWRNCMHKGAWCPVSKQLPLSWGSSIAGSPSFPPASPQPHMHTPLPHKHTTPGMGWEPLEFQDRLQSVINIISTSNMSTSLVPPHLFAGLLNLPAQDELIQNEVHLHPGSSSSSSRHHINAAARAHTPPARQAGC